MGTRRLARETALQALYLHDTCRFSLDQANDAVAAQMLPEQVRGFFHHLVQGVFEKQEEIDRIISKYAENWELGRMAAVDRNILRIATLEILSDTTTPISVIIDEAIEISKTYSTEESGKFINGVLDKIKQERKTN